MKVLGIATYPVRVEPTSQAPQIPPNSNRLEIQHEMEKVGGALSTGLQKRLQRRYERTAIARNCVEEIWLSDAVQFLEHYRRYYRREVLMQLWRGCRLSLVSYDSYEPYQAEVVHYLATLWRQITTQSTATNRDGLNTSRWQMPLMFSCVSHTMSRI